MGRRGEIEPGENRRFGLGAEALQSLHLVSEARLTQFVEGVDAQLFMERRRLFRP